MIACFSGFVCGLPVEEVFRPGCLDEALGENG